VACDTAPLAERAYAERAGVGWIGKHTNLIDAESGSFVFLGEIVTTLALPADPPSRKTCGACRRCIDVCPTGALRGDYTIDATRCISDLTQRTDGIPRNLRPLVGTWVWGCDLCQDVCPPTMRRGRTASMEFEPQSADIASPDLQRMLRIRAGQFRRTFAQTAMGWRGPAILRRNAAVALGNGLDRADVPVLVESLRGDPHPMVRGHVAWALGRIASPRAFSALRASLDTESDPSVREEITCALAG
jgi:epoxyqueuosine reductase